MATPEARHPGVVVSVVGPTASGKTELAIAIAQRLGTEIVNADARQIYRHMAIGTAQPTVEERAAATHHLVDFLEPSQTYSAGAFEEDAVPLISSLCQSHGSAVLAGGSGMYIKAALEGLDALPADPNLRSKLNARLNSEGLAPLVAELRILDPQHVETMDASNPQRVVRALEVCLASGRPFSSFHTGQKKARPWYIVSIGLDPQRDELRERIALRTHAMMRQGWLQETRELMRYREENALNTVGYKELFQHLEGTMSLEEAVELVITRTRQFAKRQMTWFKKDSATTWFNYTSSSRDLAFDQAIAFAIAEVDRLRGKPLPQ